MAKKEDLEWLLKLLSEIKKEGGNEWFWEEIAKKYSIKILEVTDAKHPLEKIDTNVTAIHKYLTLDVIPVIDYSLIEDVHVRNQLYRDCLEMGKYRLGKINDQINFEEFAKYAHMQAEELINYYLLKRYKDILTIKDTILLFHSTARIADKKDLGEIPYSTKLKAFSNQFRLPSDVKYCLEQVKNLRNYLSHRSSLDKKSEDEILIEAKKLPRQLDYNNQSEENQRKIKIQNESKTIIFSRKAEWDLVYRSLNELLGAVLKEY